jgi:hypothetical protein
MSNEIAAIAGNLVALLIGSTTIVTAFAAGWAAGRVFVFDRPATWFRAAALAFTWAIIAAAVITSLQVWGG